MKMSDFYVGEYGDTLTVTMPFDATEDNTLTIEVKKPNGSTVQWTNGFTTMAASVSRVVAENDLDVAGIYKCAVVSTRTSPERVRRAPFELRVGDPLQ